MYDQVVESCDLVAL